MSHFLLGTQPVRRRIGQLVCYKNIQTPFYLVLMLLLRFPNTYTKLITGAGITKYWA